MRRKERKKRLDNNKKTFIALIILAIVGAVLVLVLILFKISNLPKFIVVNRNELGGADIFVIDSISDKTKRYRISPDQQLVSAYGLGDYRMESLWKLGDNEKKNDLVSKTIASNYFLPCHLWRNGKNTNLNLFQKIKFLVVLKSDTIETEDLKSLDLPKSVLIDFINEDIQERGLAIEIEDLTGETQTIDKVSNIVGTIGTKVSGYLRGFDETLDCEVYAKDQIVRNLFVDIFGCKGYSWQEENKVKMKLGAKFSDRF